jgi:hypothetical protein
MGIVVLCIALAIPFQASQAVGGGAATVKDFLTGWQGNWNATAIHAESGGRYTVDWCAAEVAPSTGGSIAFTVKPASGKLIFEGSLKPTAPDKYLLSVKSADSSIVDLPMQYSSEGGFSGTGTFKNVPVEASIARKENGYVLHIVDPKLPKPKEYPILSFDFFKKVN